MSKTLPIIPMRSGVLFPGRRACPLRQVGPRRCARSRRRCAIRSTACSRWPSATTATRWRPRRPVHDRHDRDDRLASSAGWRRAARARGPRARHRDARRRRTMAIWPRSSPATEFAPLDPQGFDVRRAAPRGPRARGELGEASAACPRRRWSRCWRRSRRPASSPISSRATSTCRSPSGRRCSRRSRSRIGCAAC